MADQLRVHGHKQYCALAASMPNTGAISSSKDHPPHTQMSPEEQGQWGNPSDPVRNKSMPEDHPRAAPGDPQPHRLAGANTQ